MTETNPPLTPEAISEWAGSGKAKQTAAVIAGKISAGILRPRAELPANSTLAARWGISARTVSAAKKLLADHGVLIFSISRRRYYVA